MIITKLQGGLGNQMFQYAFGYALSKKNHQPLKFDLRDLKQLNESHGVTPRDFQLDIFGINEDQASWGSLYTCGLGMSSIRLRAQAEKYLSMLTAFVIREGRHYSLPTPRNKNIYLSGYWQSEAFFSGYEQEIRDQFQVKVAHSDDVLKLSEVICTNKESVCVFVRRTDFIGSDIHETTDLKYFERARQKLESLGVKNPSYFIFTDDIEWCIKNLHLNDDQFIVDEKYYGFKYASKFFLMTQCAHFIISNSTYGWWAAWLSNRQEEKIVVAPSRWFGNDLNKQVKIIPKEWHCT